MAQPPSDGCWLITTYYPPPWWWQSATTLFKVLIRRSSSSHSSSTSFSVNCNIQQWWNPWLTENDFFSAATAATILFSTTGHWFSVLLNLSAVAAVPPLFTKLPAFPILGWLLGNHLDPCKKGMMEASLTGEIPKTPVKEETIDDEEDEEEDVEIVFFYFQKNPCLAVGFCTDTCVLGSDAV